MWNQEVLAVPELVCQKELHLILLSQLPVDQGHRCNKLEGQTNAPTREGDSDESTTSDGNVTFEDIPDELGCEWRVLHPFKLPGVRFPMDSTPQIRGDWLRTMHWWNLSRLQNICMMYLHGDKGTIDFTPFNMVTPSTEEEVEEEVEVEEDENGFKKDQWIDQMEDWGEDSPMAME